MNTASEKSDENRKNHIRNVVCMERGKNRLRHSFVKTTNRKIVVKRKSTKKDLKFEKKSNEVYNTIQCRLIVCSVYEKKYVNENAHVCIRVHVQISMYVQSIDHPRMYIYIYIP